MRSQASKALRMPPISVRSALISPKKSSRRAKERTPAVRSEWPPRYLVPEWKARSAPSSRARSVQGGAAVQSAARRAPAAWAACGRGGDVDDVPGRVGRDLDPDQAGGRADGFGERDGVGGVEGGERDAAALLEAAEPGEAAVVHDVGADDVVAAAEGFGQGHEGGHAAGEGEAGGGAVEVGEDGLGVGDGGAALAGVDVRLAGGVGLVAGEGGGEVEGRGDRAGRRVDVAQRLGGAGGGGEGSWRGVVMAG